MKRIQIKPLSRPISGVVNLPGSKSMTNRALLMATLAQGNSLLHGVLDAQDTQAMMQALRTLGVSLAHDPDTQTCHVTGTGGMIQATAGTNIDCQDAGTVMRFLTPALAAMRSGHYCIQGSEVLSHRPIQNLLTNLRIRGAEITDLSEPGCLPISLNPHGLSGGCYKIDTQESSQFLSGLLISAPLSQEALTLMAEDIGPYVHITTQMMTDFGVNVITGPDRFQIQPSTYQAREYTIEPDASTASYFFALAMLTGGAITLPGLLPDCLQGDIAFLDILTQLGGQASSVLTNGQRGIHFQGCATYPGITVDMRHCSDTFMTLCALAPFATSPTHIHNIAHTRRQESDRIDAMAHRLQACGVRVETRPDGISIYPSQPHAADIDGANDHRIAMSMSLIGYRVGLSLAGSTCIGKTCPNFYTLVESLCQ